MVQFGERWEKAGICHRMIVVRNPCPGGVQQILRSIPCSSLFPLHCWIQGIFTCYNTSCRLPELLVLFFKNSENIFEPGRFFIQASNNTVCLTSTRSSLRIIPGPSPDIGSGTGASGSIILNISPHTSNPEQ